MNQPNAMRSDIDPRVIRLRISRRSHAGMLALLLVSLIGMCPPAQAARDDAVIVQWLMELGEDSQKKGNPEDALGYYRKVLLLRPWHPEAVKRVQQLSPQPAPPEVREEARRADQQPALPPAPQDVRVKAVAKVLLLESHKADSENLQPQAADPIVEEVPVSAMVAPTPAPRQTDETPSWAVPAAADQPAAPRVRMIYPPHTPAPEPYRPEAFRAPFRPWDGKLSPPERTGKPEADPQARAPETPAAERDPYADAGPPATDRRPAPHPAAWNRTPEFDAERVAQRVAMEWELSRLMMAKDRPRLPPPDGPVADAAVEPRAFQSGPSAGFEHIRVAVNGRRVKLAQPVEVIDGDMLVSCRSVAEALGYTVTSVQPEVFEFVSSRGETWRRDLPGSDDWLTMPAGDVERCLPVSIDFDAQARMLKIQERQQAARGFRTRYPVRDLP
jgi:hypothetical protein